MDTRPSAEHGHLIEKLQPLNKWLDDPEMVEIAINPDNKIWILKRGDASMSDTGETFKDAKRLADLAAGATYSKTSSQKLLVSTSISVGRRPIRLQAALQAALHNGEAALSLRLHSSVNIDDIKLTFLHGKSRSSSTLQTEKLTKLDALIESGNLMQALAYCVDSRLNVLIAGGTDTGKTVALRKIISLISREDRIITIEDAAELYPSQPNCVSLIADRSSDARSTDKLLEASLRMRPDRLIVGEIRGKEAMTFLEAINTGHGGSMSTIHAETPELAIDRLAIAAAKSGVPMTYDNLIDYISRTIDVVIQAGREGGKRGIEEIYNPRKRIVA
jgi:type IV secretion system protein VirB11